MRFIVMHKMTEEMETGIPDLEIVEAVGKLIQQGAKENVFVSGEGLKPTSERVHIAYKNGKRTITEGPFADAKELAAGFELLRVRSKEEAISWCDRFAAVIGDVELFLGPVVEPWDLGMMPKPKNAPLRFLLVHQLDERSTSDASLEPALMAKMSALVEEMTNAGALQTAFGLSGTRHGARVHYKGGQPTVLDGPFAESKELIAGYAILDLPSKAAAIDWAIRFGQIVKVNEVEVRQIPQG